MKDGDRDAKFAPVNPVHSTQDHLSVSRKNSHSVSADQYQSKVLRADASRDSRAQRTGKFAAAGSQEKSDINERSSKLTLQLKVESAKKPPAGADRSTLEDRLRPHKHRPDPDSPIITQPHIIEPSKAEEGQREQKIVYINSSYDKLDIKPLETPLEKELQAAWSTGSSRKVSALGVTHNQPRLGPGLKHLPGLSQLGDRQLQSSGNQGYNRPTRLLEDASVTRDSSAPKSRKQIEAKPDVARNLLDGHDPSIEASVQPVGRQLSKDASLGPARDRRVDSHFPNVSISSKHMTTDKPTLEQSPEALGLGSGLGQVKKSHKQASSKQSLSQLLKKKPVRDGRPLLFGHGSSKSYLLPDLPTAHQAAAASKSLNSSTVEVPVLSESQAQRRGLAEVSSDLRRLLQETDRSPPLEPAEIERQNREMQQLLVESKGSLQSALSQSVEQRLREARRLSSLDSYQKSTVDKIVKKYERDGELNALVIRSMESELAKLTSSLEQRTQPAYSQLIRSAEDLLVTILATHDQIDQVSSELALLKKQASANTRLLRRGSGSSSRLLATPAMHENAKLLRDLSQAASLRAILEADCQENSTELARQKQKLQELQAVRGQLESTAAALGLDDRELLLTFDRLAESRSKLQAGQPQLLQSLEQRVKDSERNCERLARAKDGLARMIEEAEWKTNQVLEEAKRLAVEESQKELSLITKIALIERSKVLEATRQHHGFSVDSYRDIDAPVEPRPAPRTGEGAWPVPRAFSAAERREEDKRRSSVDGGEQ